MKKLGYALLVSLLLGSTMANAATFEVTLSRGDSVYYFNSTQPDFGCLAMDLERGETYSIELDVNEGDAVSLQQLIGCYFGVDLNHRLEYIIDDPDGTYEARF